MEQRDIMGGLAKGLAVIETFRAENPRQTISQVAAESGLDRATARRCLLTLANQGYADYDGKFFTLTPRILRLGTACLATMPLPQIVQPWLDKLSDGLGESTSVSILDGDEIVYIARAAQRKVMSISLTPGSRLPAYCTSMGRVLLAALPKGEAETLLKFKPLKVRTPHTITEHDKLSLEIQNVREQGFAMINQEVELGLISIAVPLINTHNHVVAALNLGLSTHSTQVDQLAPLFLEKLRSIQAELHKVII